MAWSDAARAAALATRRAHTKNGGNYFTNKATGTVTLGAPSHIHGQLHVSRKAYATALRAGRAQAKTMPIHPIFGNKKFAMRNQEAHFAADTMLRYPKKR